MVNAHTIHDCGTPHAQYTTKHVPSIQVHRCVHSTRRKRHFLMRLPLSTNGFSAEKFHRAVGECANALANTETITPTLRSCKEPMPMYSVLHLNE